MYGGWPCMHGSCACGQVRFWGFNGGFGGILGGHARVGLHVRGKIGNKQMRNAWNGQWKVVRGMSLMGIGKWV